MGPFLKLLHLDGSYENSLLRIEIFRALLFARVSSTTLFSNRNSDYNRVDEIFHPER